MVINMERRFHTVGIAGLGLIGGSLALALQRLGGIAVHGYDLDGDTLEAAVHAGAITRANEGLGECDLVVVALYPGAAVHFVGEHIAELRPGTVVADFCGIKRFPCAVLEPLCRARGLYYLGAHPMAGKEISGFAAADANLFRGASLILTPTEETDPAALAAFQELCREVGFGRLVRSTPEGHDRIIAYTSQLAHILSSAYIQNPLSSDFSGFTGGSFQDLTRVARMNGEMWAELFERNRDMLIEQIDELTLKLGEYRQALENEDSRALWALMEQGTAIKNRLLAGASDPKWEEV